MIRKLLLFIMLLGLAGCITAAKKSDFIGDAGGFRGYEWGIYLEEVAEAFELQGFDEKRDIEWFTKKDDPLHIGEADLKSIHYVFRDDRLVAVSIIAKKGKSNYKVLQEELEKRLGKAQFEKVGALSWDLKHSLVLFNFNSQSETAMLVIRARVYRG